MNEVLSSIGESPVNSLDSGMDDANLALHFLRTVSRDVQSVGWYFNTEQGFRLSPDSQGNVPVPENTLRLDSNRTDFMLRSGKLYDSVNHSYKIGKQVTVDLVLGLQFADLPETARRFITLKTCRVFQQRTVGSQSLAQDLKTDEQAAWIALRSDHINATNVNLFDNAFMAAGTRRGPSRTTAGFVGGEVWDD